MSQFVSGNFPRIFGIFRIFFVDFMNYLAIYRLFFSPKCFSENKKINFFYPFPFFSFSPSSFFAQSLKSTAAPSFLGPVAAQHPQLAA
jgi:hypothetical protein